MTDALSVPTRFNRVTFQIKLLFQLLADGI
jgi:hypothetical protein